MIVKLMNDNMYDKYGLILMYYENNLMSEFLIDCEINN